MDPPKRSLSLTKSEACLRHIEAAIAAFERGLFDVAITLAGAAEGMTPATDAPHFFTHLRDHPRAADIVSNKKQWVTMLNAERNWLKHNNPDEPDQMSFERAAASIMITRAITKAEAAFGLGSPMIDIYRHWLLANLDDL
jgi:hypothetical protein